MLVASTRAAPGTTATAVAIEPEPAEVVKAAQRTGWNGQARQFHAHHEIIERQWGPLSNGLLELARVTPGDRGPRPRLRRGETPP